MLGLGYLSAALDWTGMHAYIITCAADTCLRALKQALIYFNILTHPHIPHARCRRLQTDRLSHTSWAVNGSFFSCYSVSGIAQSRRIIFSVLCLYGSWQKKPYSGYKRSLCAALFWTVFSVEKYVLQSKEKRPSLWLRSALPQNTLKIYWSAYSGSVI